MTHAGPKLCVLILTIIVICAMTALGQSTTQDFPTPILTNELTGTIKARTIGDSRLTTHYYTFNGEQGDVFINLVTRNLTGDFDVFTVDGLRPVTKIAVYADYGENETGRAVYLRKPEKLILRVQGRTPNDDEAFYRIKFAGSFAAVRPEDVRPAPEMPRVSSEARREEKAADDEKADVTATDRTKEKVADLKPVEEKVTLPVDDRVTERKIGEEAKKPNENETKEVTPENKAEPSVSETADDKKSEEEKKKIDEIENKDAVSTKKAEVILADPLARKAEDVAAKPDEKTPVEPEAEVIEKAAEPPTPATSPRTRARRTPPARTKAEPKPDPLASINLVIEFKDGNSLERNLSEVQRFSVDRGVLVVVLKTGKISRYPIADVAKVTIQ